MPILISPHSMCFDRKRGTGHSPLYALYPAPRKGLTTTKRVVTPYEMLTSRCSITFSHERSLELIQLPTSAGTRHPSQSAAQAEFRRPSLTHRICFSQ